VNYDGGCHCGALRFSFETDRPLSPRACQCGFCRRHNARAVSDPDGAATLVLGPETIRYRFGLGVTDFLICGRCGVYIGALARIDGADLMTLNLDAFDEPHLGMEAVPSFYDGESAEVRSARRRERWTPVRR
jgi:hypothetical protein